MNASHTNERFVWRLHIPSYMHTYIHACMHACIHTCIHTNQRYVASSHTYIHTYIHAYIHTYIHTYMRMKGASGFFTYAPRLAPADGVTEWAMDIDDACRFACVLICVLWIMMRVSGGGGEEGQYDYICV